MPVKTDSLGLTGRLGLTQIVIRHLDRFRRRILTGTALLSGGYLASALPALAQASVDTVSPGAGVSSFEVINFAMVIGAISAAMISAIWLIRERGKIDLENVQLRAALADANAISASSM